MNNFPGLELYNDNNNPTLMKDTSPWALPFYQTRDTLLDVESYRSFLTNCINRFRSSPTYTNYKAFLFELGLDHCQLHGNLNSQMVTIEMHHNIINIFDITLIISEHLLNTIGYITTFDIVKELKKVHVNNKIPLVMLSLTPHQLYHDEPLFFISPDQCVGKWWEFVEEYKYGLTEGVAFKLISYINKYLDGKTTDDSGLLELRDSIIDWSNKIYG